MGKLRLREVTLLAQDHPLRNDRAKTWICVFLFPKPKIYTSVSVAKEDVPSLGTPLPAAVLLTSTHLSTSTLPVPKLSVFHICLPPFHPENPWTSFDKVSSTSLRIRGDRLLHVWPRAVALPSPGRCSRRRLSEPHHWFRLCVLIHCLGGLFTYQSFYIYFYWDVIDILPCINLRYTLV